MYCNGSVTIPQGRDEEKKGKNSPVIGRHKQNVAVLLASLEDATNGLVGGGDTLDGGLVDASVADHVRGRKVVHHKGVAVLRNALGHAVGDGGSAHLGVEVVGGDLGRGDHVAVLARELLLDAAIEEEGDVGVLFRLSDVALRQAMATEPLG